MKAVMNEAELYQSSNILQKRDAERCLREYGHKIKWKAHGARVIDIGCGDGSVTTSVLKNHLPNNFEELIGCDISQKMISHANIYHKDRRISYRVMDIEGDLPKHFNGAFDHAFSFYTLHWVRQQEKAFNNIYSLLRKGGGCFLIFLGHMPVYDVYRIMCRNIKWAGWLRDVEKYISPYHDSQEPEKEVRRLMEKIGFKNIDVKCDESVIVYDKLEMLKKAVMAVNPFSLPKYLQDEFMEDYVDAVRDLRLMDEENNNLNEDVVVKANYSLIIAYGTR